VFRQQQGWLAAEGFGGEKGEGGTWGDEGSGHGKGFGGAGGRTGLGGRDRGLLEIGDNDNFRRACSVERKVFSGGGR